MDRRPRPAQIDAYLFDLDGVLTQTAKLHMAAWKEMFDEFLRERTSHPEGAFEEFSSADYTAHVDGRLRQDGVRFFLRSRGVELPEGEADDPPGAETLHGLGNRKNALVLDLIEERGVEVYDGSIRYLEAVRAAGKPTAVVSASRNCQKVLAATGIEHLFDVRFDGVVAAERGLPGKPAPDTFLAAAAELGVEPDRSAVIEDATSGVEAGRVGGFGWVVGVDRAGHADALYAHGADIVVSDLAELPEPE